MGGGAEAYEKLEPGEKAAVLTAEFFEKAIAVSNREDVHKAMENTVVSLHANRRREHKVEKHTFIKYITLKHKELVEKVSSIPGIKEEDIQGIVNIDAEYTANKMWDRLVQVKKGNSVNIFQEAVDAKNDLLTSKASKLGSFYHKLAGACKFIGWTRAEGHFGQKAKAKDNEINIKRESEVEKLRGGLSNFASSIPRVSHVSGKKSHKQVQPKSR